MPTAVVAVNVSAGDVLCPVEDTTDPQKLTKATPAALATGVTVTGIAAEPAAAGATVTYFAASETVPAATTGLGPGPATAVVVDGSARAERRFPLTPDAWVLGPCDAQGVLSLAPRHEFANVMDFGAKGDDSGDDWAAINAAMQSLTPGTGTGTVYFPAGTYRISRPIVVNNYPGIELLGESQQSTAIRLLGNFGPTLCITPDTVGHFPTGDALLSGPGKAGVFRLNGGNTVDFRDSPALDMDGLDAFSVECTVQVDQVPVTGTTAVITSSGRRNARDPQNSAFGVFLTADGTGGGLALSATVRVGGRDVSVPPPAQPLRVPTGVTTHIALAYDGSRLRLFAGSPGAQTDVREVPAAGKLGQALEEGVYLGVYSGGSWPEYHPVTKQFPGRIDSIRLSDRAMRTAPFTAPTAKFPTDNASNLHTLLLVNFDLDVDVFTVGRTWKDRPGSSPILVHCLHYREGPPNDVTSPIVRRLTFQSSGGAGIQAQLAAETLIDQVNVTAARDGIRFRDVSLRSGFEDIVIAVGRLGLVLAGDTALVNVKRLKVAGARYDFVATGAIGVFARDWLIGTGRSVVPVMLSSGANYGFFHGTGVAISSEDVQNMPPEGRKWQAAVMASSLTSLLLESSVLQPAFSDTTQCPCVILDSSDNGPGASNYTFINCDFQPSPDSHSILELSGRTLPHPVRIIGSRKTPLDGGREIPWTLPHQASLVSFLGGAVSTTDTGLTQWQGTRDWIFAYDAATGLFQAREHESQATGSVPAGGTVELGAMPLAAGTTFVRAEVVASGPLGTGARWVLEQGFARTGETVATWAPDTRVAEAFGSDGGVPPDDWEPPALAAADGRAVVRCTAPDGQKLAFTVRLRAVEALAPAP
ncbi:glycosyl hydrolase family 28-related protein [Streptomyces sp. NPDC048045]|uniref:glycosyl hydrolase family 28-related protein n=1 Tax=Streptomyces sp. NPDC048045 TaxID=3154710 RepID=UPI00341A60D1